MAHEHIPHDPDDPEDDFKALIASLDKPRILDQRELLNDVLAQHKKMWWASGIFDKAADKMDMPLGKGDMTLTKIFETDPSGSPIEIHRLSTRYTVMIKDEPNQRMLPLPVTKHVDVSHIKDGGPSPQPPFDESDAVLIASQVAELEELRYQGHLPDLSPDLSSITSPRK